MDGSDFMQRPILAHEWFHLQKVLMSRNTQRKKKMVDNGVNSREVLSPGKWEGLSNSQNGEQIDVEVNEGGFHSFYGNDVYQECLAHGINEADNV
jgi:hypothetical protein